MKYRDCEVYWLENPDIKDCWFKLENCEVSITGNRAKVGNRLFKLNSSICFHFVDSAGITHDYNKTFGSDCYSFLDVKDGES